MNAPTVQRLLARWGWAFSILALVLLLAVTWYLDRQNQAQFRVAREQALTAADTQAVALAETIAAEMAGRIGSLAAAKLQFTQLQDSISQPTFLSALDSVIAGVPGLGAVTVIRPDSSAASSSAALLRRTWAEPLTMPEVGAAYQRAITTREPTATGVLDLVGGQRFIVFDPVIPTDSGPVRAVLAAELEPLVIIRAALEQEREALGPAFYNVYDPNGRRITSLPSPANWDRAVRPIQVANSEWAVAVAHQPVNARFFETLSGVVRIAGVLLAVGFAVLLFLLWRTVKSQQQEIGRRVAAEESASRNAAEAKELADQLASAQEAALRLSASLTPDQLIDDFLGLVGEVLDADVALLYGFDEHGEEAIGRRRLLLDPEAAATIASSEDDFRDVRVPVSLVPHLSNPISTGEPFLVNGGDDGGGGDRPLGGAVARPNAALSVPLKIGGHLVGLAVWESFRTDARMDPRHVAFAGSVGAQAGASLRAAELIESVRQARMKADREAARLATVLDRMTDAVVLLDAAGCMERINPAAEELLGADVVTQPVQEWPTLMRFWRDGRRLRRRDFALPLALEGESMDRYRFRLEHAGGDRHITASAAPIRGEDNTVRGVVIVMRDVTDEHEYAEILRRTNDELRQQAALLERTNDDLQSATLAKDQFLAMMSHELRTPINAILGYADLLDMGVHGGLNDKQRQMITRVVETSRHLLGLVNDVLDLTKIAAGRIDLRIETVALRPVLMKAAHQIAPLAEGKGLDVEVVIEEEIMLRADETRVAQILINLASNASKFTETGGIVLRAETTENCAWVRVIDSGPGIPEEEVERIFEEFHQVDAGHSRRAGGTGLGLAISRRLARLMGGDLTVRSELGKGTEFTVVLPLAESPEAESPAEASDEARGRQRAVRG